MPFYDAPFYKGERKVRKVITANRAAMVDGAPTKKMLDNAIAAHRAANGRRAKLRGYYLGRAGIDQRTRAAGLPNSKIAGQYAYYITTMAAGYMIGAPVKYESLSQPEALNAVKDQYKANNVDSVDIENATLASMMGVGVEILYADENASPRAAALSPLEAFVVYDDRVENRPLFGVRCWQRQEEGACVQYADVYTKELIYHRHGGSFGTETLDGAEQHYFGGVPMIEYWNSAEEMGDFERVLNEIDAYNIVQSDRVNDKQQFTDALLITRGVQELAAQPEDENDTRPPSQRIKDDGMIMFPDKDADASYLTKQLSQGDNQVLLEALNRDIHKFSLVPDLTDQHFAGNSSGVAMKFKLLGLEQLTKVKERWFREGLKTRMTLFAHFMEMKGAPALDVAEVKVVFTHSLPVNEWEEAKTAQALRGLVADEAILSRLSFLEG